jgi:diguanylate cyclase (GGDEF)-like protein
VFSSLAGLLKGVTGRLGGLFSAETDQLLLRARASGERLVAKVRLGLALILGAFSVTLGSGYLILALVVGGIVYGSVLLIVATRYYRAWVSWTSCALDVLLITSCLASFVHAQAPLIATNSRVLYELYFLAIMTSGLRYDWKLCAWSSFLATSAFFFLSLVAKGQLGINDPSVVVSYGNFSWPSQIQRTVLLGVAGMVMAAVAQYAKSLRLMVGVDHLTGLSQRAPFVERIDEELARSRRRGASLSVAVLDIDGFKGFNDAFGHPAGDRALQILAGRLRSSVRKSDLVARFGGEEFVVAFPETEVDQATARVETIRAELARVPIAVGRDTHHLTISAGVGSWPIDGETFDAVLAKADVRLYEAKRKGRNQVIGPLPVQLATVTELKKR